MKSIVKKPEIGHPFLLSVDFLFRCRRDTPDIGFGLAQPLDLLILQMPICEEETLHFIAWSRVWAFGKFQMVNTLLVHWKYIAWDVYLSLTDGMVKDCITSLLCSYSSAIQYVKRLHIAMNPEGILFWCILTKPHIKMLDTL